MEMDSDFKKMSRGQSSMENWNQDLLERYSNFCGLHIKFRGTENDRGPGEVDRKVRVIGSAAPVMESGGKHV